MTDKRIKGLAARWVNSKDSDRGVVVDEVTRDANLADVAQLMAILGGIGGSHATKFANLLRVQVGQRMPLAVV